MTFAQDTTALFGSKPIVLIASAGGDTADAWTLPLVDVTRWIDHEPPDRRFVVDGWLARGTAALLVGEDGVGKSLLAQQLATCVATGRPFLGLDVEKGAALYVTCEDDPDELWRRQRAINRTLNVPIGAAPAMLASLVGHTGVELGYYDQHDHFQLTPVAQGIAAAAKSRGASLIVLDNLAHMFPGNENVRRDVAVFCAALERMAIDADATVLILAHPSKAGAEYSGSTGWSAHVRQRWFLERGDADLGTDRDARVLRKSKANYSAAGVEVAFRWHEWAFTTDDDLSGSFYVDNAANAQASAENEAFLRCLDAASRSFRAVSHNQGVNYAPNIFARMPEGKGFKVEAFKRAFERLLHLGQIELDQQLWQRGNRVWKTGIKRADAAPTPIAPSRTHKRTDPHQPPSQVVDNACTDLHAPTPLYTTYISGAAHDAAAPDGSDLDWETGLTVSDSLATIARRVGRLRPDWRDPERYFEERSEIERELRLLVRRVERDNQHG